MVYEAASHTENIKKTVILDAGHGGFDGGASAGDVLEKDINLKIALFLADHLKLSGYDVILTREDDSATNDEGDRIRSKKISDMKNRLALMKSYPDAFFVSIHLNKYSDSQPKGTQVFYSQKTTESKLLAQSIQQTVKELLQSDNHREIKPATRDTYLLYNAPIPAVIVECGFLSNPAELALLKTEEYQKKMAFAVYCGIIAGEDAEQQTAYILN